MTWWLWAFLGLILLAIEIVTPGGFYMLFFGIGALIVGALVGLGAVQSEWMAWLLFSLVSVASLALLRPTLRRLLASGPDGAAAVDTMTGETALAVTDMAPNAAGKAECRGSTWNAHNAGSTPLRPGQRGRVQRVDGITLWITAE